jgi:uncharacterized protein YabE (DUF348 family)
MRDKNPQSEEKKSKPRFHRLRHPFMVPVATFLVLFFVSVVVFISQSGQTVGAGDSRLVELSMDGTTQTIPTTAPTVGNLLARLNIHLNSGDVVEPNQDTPIFQNGFQINIYRVHPVTVVEGNNRTVVLTATSDARAIAAQAGYKLYPEDYVNSSAPAADTNQNVLGNEVVVDPATPVNLTLYGQAVTIRTHAKTVGDLLTAENIKTNSGNNVIPALDTPITAGLPILVVPVGQKLISTQQVIPFTTQNVDDPSIAYGTTQITQAGVNGLALVVEDITVKNGVTTNTPMQQVIVTQPVPEIIHHGTGIVAVAGGNNISWLKSSNISVNDYSYVNVVITRETHWNPDDINGSGCIGLGQSCPGSSGVAGLAVVCPDWQSNAVCQLDFFNSYAISRYGSWAGAAEHSDTYGWW